MDSPYQIGKVPLENKHYIEKSLLGKGSYGSVYLVQESINRKYYANKKIKYLTRTKYDKQSIINEIRLLACHQCPHIIQLHNAYIKDGYLNLITEYAKRGDLSKLIKRYKARGALLEEVTIKKYLFELCIAVEYLHKNNVIHRDIKTANVFLSKSDNIKLGDLGIIKVLMPAYKYANTNIGTPYYMSPELYKHQRYNTKTDIWSIGVLLYELMTLKLPYNANNLKDLKYKISNSNWRLSSKYRAIYSTDLCDLLSHMLDSNPLTRYNINQVLTHNYFKAKYTLYTVDNSYNPLNIAFYSKSIIPYTVVEWKNILKKYLINNKNQSSPKNEDYKKYSPNKNIQQLPSINRANIPFKNNLNYNIENKQLEINNKPVIKDKPVINNGYEINKNKYTDDMLDLLNDMELLMKYISSSRFNSYYILKQDIKKRLKNIKRDL